MKKIVRSLNGHLQGFGGFKALGLARDAYNLLHYGNMAPRFAERIFIDPKSCEYSIRLGSQVFSSGRVLKKTIGFEKKSPLQDEPLIIGCLAHWINGQDWDSTGLLRRLTKQVEEAGIADCCRSERDVIDRYERLDQLFDQVKMEGRLRSKIELGGYREMGGVLIHIGPDGEFYFGGNGNHRLAIALALELDEIPAQLGSIHIGALGLLPALRLGRGRL